MLLLHQIMFLKNREPTRELKQTHVNTWLSVSVQRPLSKSKPRKTNYILEGLLSLGAMVNFGEWGPNDSIHIDLTVRVPSFYFPHTKR